MKRSPDLLRASLQKNLSGLRLTNDRRAAIREKIQGGHKTMKRKMPLALILALVLALLTVTAYALSNWDQIKDYLGSVRKLSYETQGWPLEDRLRLVELMHEAGLVEDEEAYQKLQDPGLSETEKIEYSDRIISARYGADWYWADHETIENVEWPVEKRYESLESLIEYEKWNDQQQREWESEHPEEEQAFFLLSEADAGKAFHDGLVSLFGFTEDSLDDSRFILTHHANERIWECSYAVNADHPGWHQPSAGDQLDRYTEETTVIDYIKTRFVPDYLREAIRDQDSIEIVMTFDDWGRDARTRVMDMEHTMIGHMHDALTEIYCFTYESIESDRILVCFDERAGLWTASYTVDADHPGVFDNIPGEHEADTVYESLCNAYGEEPSFTLTVQKTALNRNRNEDPHPPYDESFIGEDAAIRAARSAILEKYGCDEKTLDEMTAAVCCTQNDGADEYYVEFIGYDHFSEDMARLWNYATRVDAVTGAVLAAVSREEWEPMTGEKLVVDDTNREYVLEDRLRRALYQAAGETEDKTIHQPLYIKNDTVYFMDWTLEEKAEYSRTVKPRIDRFLAEHPEDAEYYLAQDRNRQYTIVAYYIATTRHAYGLPDEKAIPREQAFDLACQAVHAQYRTAVERLKSGKVCVYYDVTDPDHPLWKFEIDILNTALDLNSPYRFFAALDAYTGEIVTLQVENPRNPSDPAAMSDFM